MTDTPAPPGDGLEALKVKLGSAIAHGTYFDEEAREKVFEEILADFTALMGRRELAMLKEIEATGYDEDFEAYDFNRIVDAFEDKIKELEALLGEGGGHGDSN